MSKSSNTFTRRSTAANYIEPLQQNIVSAKVKISPLLPFTSVSKLRRATKTDINFTNNSLFFKISDRWLLTNKMYLRVKKVSTPIFFLKSLTMFVLQIKNK